MQLYIFLSKSMIKIPVYKYGRHWLSQPMRIEAPIPYISDMSFHQKCPGYSDLGVTLLQEKMQAFYFNFAIIGQFYEYAIWPEVSTTSVSWCFAIICIIICLGEKCTPFFNCVITCQYMEYILWREVSTTPESGCFSG